MSQFDYENSRDSMNETAKRNYSAAVGDSQENVVRGLHTYNTPNVHDEERPWDWVVDTPTENFIPTPTYNVSDLPKSKVKKMIKVGLLVLFAAFLIYCFVMIFIDSPQLFKFQPITWR